MPLSGPLVAFKQGVSIMTNVDTAEAVLNAAEGLLWGRFPELTDRNRPDGFDIKRGSNANDHGYVGAYLYGGAVYFAVIAEVWPALSTKAAPPGTFSASVLIRRPSLDPEGAETEEFRLTGRSSLSDLSRELQGLLDGFNPYARPFVVMLDGGCTNFGAMEVGQWQAELSSGRLPGNRVAVVLAETARQALIEFQDQSPRTKAFEVMIAAGLEALPDTDPAPGYR